MKSRLLEQTQREYNDMKYVQTQFYIYILQWEVKIGKIAKYFHKQYIILYKLK
jgi:hypothetical protein